MDRLYTSSPDPDAQILAKSRGLIRVGHQLAAALSERAPFDDAITTIADLCAAEHVSIKRYELDEQSLDVIASLHDDIRHVTEDRADTLRRMPVGTVFALPEKQDAVHVILLAHTDSYSDMIVIATRETAWLNVLALELPMIWEGRTYQVLDRIVSGQTDRRILSDKNPFRLTRAETRVCMCLADGLRPVAVSDRLGIALPTVRTHLRNIYSKTGLDGLVAVIHQLHTEKDKG